VSYTRQDMKNVQDCFSQKASVGREERSSTPEKIAAAVEAVVEAVFQYEVIKIAIDMHDKLWVMSRQLDNATPQPPQNFSPEKALEFIAKQVKLARRVVCCYEAGCFGYGPQRRIAAMGAECLVIAPQDWDERKKKVRTDKSDTLAMVQRLDRYVAGNRKALAVVRVPSLEEEVRRSRVRERQQLLGDRNRWANIGKSLLMQYGLPASWSWWKPGRWEQVRKNVKDGMGEHAEALLKMLEDYREVLTAVSEKLHALTVEQQKKQKERQARARMVRLRGIGELSMAVIESEIIDWHRFSNRRQVASYTGLCPGVSGTGGQFTGLSVNKCGNRRLRGMLVELAWLLPRYQPGYVPLQRWKAVLSAGHRSGKKKAIVALARCLAVDLWRIHTGRTTPEKLGLKLAA
jgi:transposase